MQAATFTQLGAWLWYNAPMREIVSLEARHVRFGLRERFCTAVRKADSSDSVIVRLTLRDGTLGYGEAVPLEHLSGETPDSVLKAVATASELLDGRSAATFRRLSGELLSALPGDRTARAAIDMALVDAFARSRKVPVWQMLGGSVGRLDSGLTIPICEPSRAAELAAQAVAEGFRRLKLKVGSDDDNVRLARVSEAAPEASLILDANQGFDCAGALAFLNGLPIEAHRVVALEQPVKEADLDGLKRLTEQASVPIYADESVANAEDAFAVAAAGAAAGANLKVQKSGVLGFAETAAVCLAGGLRLMVGCMLESAVGLSAAVHLACGLGCFDLVDLDSDLLIEGDIGTAGFVRKGPELAVLDLPGFGAEPPSGLFE